MNYAASGFCDLHEFKWPVHPSTRFSDQFNPAVCIRMYPWLHKHVLLLHDCFWQQQDVLYLFFYSTLFIVAKIHSILYYSPAESTVIPEDGRNMYQNLNNVWQVTGHSTLYTNTHNCCVPSEHTKTGYCYIRGPHQYQSTHRTHGLFDEPHHYNTGIRQHRIQRARTTLKKWRATCVSCILTD